MSQAKRCIHRGRQSAVAASIFLLVGCNRDPSSPIGVTAVRLETAQVSLESCEVKTLVADIVAAARTNTALTWESSDPTVAAVDELGVVTAYAHGTATLTVVSVADPRRFAQATVHVHERPAWMELVRVEDAATHARITPLILRDSVDVVAHYSPSGCRASGVVPDVLTLVVVTTTSTDLSARGWQRTAPTSQGWMRELTSESDVSADSFRTAWFRLRTTSVTETGEAVYPDGGYTASLRLHMQSGATNIGVNGYPLWVDNR